MSLDPTLRTRIDTLLASNRIVLFMKGQPRAPQCGFSAKAIGALDALGVDYTHVDVLADPEIREGIKQYGEWPTIPQLYIGGELVGGSDIIEQMANSGELYTVLGLAAPDRSPPAITITPAAAQMLREAVTNAGAGFALQIDVDARFNAKLQLAPVDGNAIATESEGLRAQFDLASARRAEGLRITGGALAEPLREFTIASTLQKMLAEAVAVGADIEWLPMRAAGVSLVVRDVTVSGA